MEAPNRIVLVTPSYLPDSVGGTEVYVAALARHLLAAGDEVIVVVTGSASPGTYRVAGIEVRRGELADFARTLDEWAPAVVHFHPLTGGDVLPWMRLAKERGVPIACTYHTPTMTCGRGDLLLFGAEPCDGVMDARRCALCVLDGKGLPRALGEPVLALSPASGDAPAWLPRKLRSTLSIASQRDRGLHAWREVVKCVDHWIAVSAWVAELLERNGVPHTCVTVSRQGVAAASGRSRARQADGGPLIAGYLGRLHPDKGLEVLLEAAALIPDARVEVKIAGSGEAQYERALRRRFESDRRLEWLGPIRPEAVAHFLSSIDVLVVPSVGVETGPLTVLEAWAAGIPVIGSDRGGIREWLAEFGGGIAFPPGDRTALADVLARTSRSELALPDAPATVRSMETVSAEMSTLYSRIGRVRCTAA